MSHPNAAAATGSTGLAVLLIWLAGYFGVDMPAEVGASIAGVLAIVTLALGRNGIRGLARAFWRGSNVSP